MVGEVLSVKELNILSTAIVTLIESKRCTLKGNGKYNIICTDQKRRRMSPDKITDLIDRLSVAAGQGNIKADALLIGKEVGVIRNV